jgi:uncharacterized protein YijF (DUF1287 family)
MLRFWFSLGFLFASSLAWSQTADFSRQIAQAAKDQVGKTLSYDPTYTSLKYPGGDVPLEKGVCTDVVIRSLRTVGMDLQVLVHEDMARNFPLYPKIWGLKQTDKNIDHRRVPNLMTYFKRKHTALPVTDKATDYQAGDIVSWMLPSGLWHVGVVSAGKVRGTERPLMIHNIGRGAQEEDALFAYEIRGHYRVKSS